MQDTAPESEAMVSAVSLPLTMSDLLLQNPCASQTQQGEAERFQRGTWWHLLVFVTCSIFSHLVEKPRTQCLQALTSGRRQIGLWTGLRSTPPGRNWPKYFSIDRSLGFGSAAYDALRLVAEMLSHVSGLDCKHLSSVVLEAQAAALGKSYG